MTAGSAPRRTLPRLDTGIPGLVNITSGGLPAGEVTLVGGVTGSGKTVFAMQYLVEGIRQFGQPGVFVSFGEPPEKLRQFVGGFGWDIAAWERENRWEFVDATTTTAAAHTVIGDGFDFAVLLNRIAAALRRVGARRVVLDSLTDLFARFGDRMILRDAVRQLFAELERMDVTTVATLARRDDYGDISTFGVEELVADNIILLRNPLEGEKRRRTIEVLKFRGAPHRRGEFPFAITADEGLVVIPLSITLRQTSSDKRTSSGNTVLDEMLGGGLFRDSITLVSGATGTGKTTLALGYTLSGIAAGETAVFVGYEESSDQLGRGIRAWGYDIDDLETRGKLHFVNDYPEVATLEEHVVRIKAAIDRTGASRLALDSLTSLRRAGSVRSFQEFTTGLTAYLKERHVTGLLTTTLSALWGSTRATDEHVSTLSDVIILLRYVESHDEVRRGIAVLKERGSGHDKSVREYTIDADGFQSALHCRHRPAFSAAPSARTTTPDSDPPSYDQPRPNRRAPGGLRSDLATPICSGSLTPRTPTAATTVPSRSFGGGGRPVIGCGSSSRRSRGSVIVSWRGAMRSPASTRRGPISTIPCSARECANALMDLAGHDAVSVLGPIDALKLKSSMTLFDLADPDEPLFRAVLDTYFDGEADEQTGRRV